MFVSSKESRSESGPVQRAKRRVRLERQREGIVTVYGLEVFPESFRNSTRDETVQNREKMVYIYIHIHAKI